MAHTSVFLLKCTYWVSSSLPPPQALTKKEDNKLKEAKLFSIISFALVLIFVVSYPILVTVVLLSTVFGYYCRPYPSYYYYGYSYSYYAYYYSRC